MKPFEERFKKDIEKVVPWHKDKKGRHKFWTLFWLTYLGIFLIFLGAAACFTAAGLRFDEENVNPWTMDWPPECIGCFVGGIILFLAGVGVGVFFAIYYPGLYKESQKIYLKSLGYIRNMLKLKRYDLTKFSKEQLKWLYKLKYIDKAQYKSTLETIQKAKRKEKEKNRK